MNWFIKRKEKSVQDHHPVSLTEYINTFSLSLRYSTWLILMTYVLGFLPVGWACMPGSTGLKVPVWFMNSQWLLGSLAPILFQRLEQQSYYWRPIVSFLFVTEGVVTPAKQDSSGTVRSLIGDWCVGTCMCTHVFMHVLCGIKDKSSFSTSCSPEYMQHHPVLWAQT